MRFLTILVSGWFLATIGFGCGGASIPSPPENAKPGPPPGPSADMTKVGKSPQKK